MFEPRINNRIPPIHYVAENLALNTSCGIREKKWCKWCDVWTAMEYLRVERNNKTTQKDYMTFLKLLMEKHDVMLFEDEDCMDPIKKNLSTYVKEYVDFYIHS